MEEKKRERKEDEHQQEQKEDIQRKPKQSKVEEFKIPLRNRKKEIIAHALVSEEDYDDVNRYTWHLTNKGYVSAKKLGAMHRYIINKINPDFSNRDIVDHINSITTDNTRTNLRIVSYMQNAQNRTKQQNVSSKFYGVTYKQKEKKWHARVRVDAMLIYLGSYNEEISAAEAYDYWLYCNSARLNLTFKMNFPLKDYSILSIRPYQSREYKRTYIGVFKISESKYSVNISSNKEKKYVGAFNNAISAAKAYDQEIVNRKLNKPLNFPEDHPGRIIERKIKVNFIPTNDPNCIQLVTSNKRIKDANIRIDACDYDKIKYYSLQLTESKKYACLHVNGKVYLLHRFIMDIIDPQVYVNHFPDADGLNCIRSNLLISNAQQNAEFKKSKFNGVVQVDNGNYRARIAKNGKAIFSKTYSDEEFARRARDLFLLDNPQYTHRKKYTDWTPDLIKEWREKLNQ